MVDGPGGDPGSAALAGPAQALRRGAQRGGGHAALGAGGSELGRDGTVGAGRLKTPRFTVKFVGA